MDGARGSGVGSDQYERVSLSALRKKSCAAEGNWPIIIGNEVANLER
jgi:hypothetical protein